MSFITRLVKGAALTWAELDANFTQLTSKLGASLTGADDANSGSLYTTVQGFITYLLSSLGSALVGFINSGVGAVQRTVQDRLRDTISVKDFGATGDFNSSTGAGGVNDTTAFLAAIAYAVTNLKTIYVPAGNYNITQSLVLTGANCYVPKMFGESPSATVLWANGFTGETPVIDLDPSYSTLTDQGTGGVAKLGVLLYPVGGTRVGTGIRFYGVDGAIVHDVKIEGFINGVEWYNDISGKYSENNTLSKVYIGGCTRHYYFNVGVSGQTSFNGTRIRDCTDNLYAGDTLVYLTDWANLYQSDLSINSWTVGGTATLLKGFTHSELKGKFDLYNEVSSGGVSQFDVSAVVGGNLNFIGQYLCSNAPLAALSSGMFLSNVVTGTWVPSIGGTATYTGTPKGTYTQHGDYYDFTLEFTVNVIGTGSIYEVTNMPYTSRAGLTQTAQVGQFSGLASAVASIYAYIDPSSTTCSLAAVAAAGSVNSTVPFAGITSGTAIKMTGRIFI